jgi:hypothetical protein
VFGGKLLEVSLGMDGFDRNNFLEFNPCTAIEYKIVNDMFVHRNSSEISQIYIGWQNGEIKLHGDKNEIDSYFKYTIERTKSAEDSSGDKLK